LAAVALLAPPGDDGGNVHDRSSREVLAARAAALVGVPLLSPLASPDAAGPDVLLIPRDTLVANDGMPTGAVRRDTLLGGLAPHRFVATKTITHGLLHPQAVRPHGWSMQMSERLGEAALEGYSAFSLEEATAAGRRLLERGPVRLKDVCAKAGLGQVVVTTPGDLVAALACQDQALISDCGIVIEQDLTDVETYSVGSVSLGTREISYIGDQQTTRDHRGRTVYGGSRLTCVQGGLERLGDLRLTPEQLTAIRCAAAFDDAACRSYPDLLLTRRNYDVIAGSDARGRRRVGVLEQSWRIGGASGAEMAALEAFGADPGLASVAAATVEVYGEATPPPGAVVYFSGVDPRVGPLTKYAVRRV
jgi:hypothetical protein